jgi:hypothetical protein
LARNQLTDSSYTKPIKVSLVRLLVIYQFSPFLAVVIGVYEGGIAPGACSVSTAHLSDYLKSTGY